MFESTVMNYTLCNFSCLQGIETHIFYYFNSHIHIQIVNCRDGSRTAATFKMERIVIIVNGWKPLTIITKRSILNPSLSAIYRVKRLLVYIC